MKKKSFFIILIIIFILFQNCIFKRKTIYFYNIENYFEIFAEKKKSYDFFKKNLSKRHYYVREVKVKNFDSFINELTKIENYKEKDFIIFLDENFSPLLIKGLGVNLNTDNFKLLTLNIPEEEIFFSSKVKTYNALVSPEIILKCLLNIFKKYTKDKNYFSDCALIYNPNYYFSKKIYELITEKNLKIECFAAYEENRELEDWIYKNKKVAIAFFGYNVNQIIMKLEKEKFNKTILIELFTEYSKYEAIAHYSINLNLNNIFYHLIHSKTFKKFINNKLELNEKNIFSELLKSPFFLEIKKNK